MKKSIFLSVIALVISAGITAQTASRNRAQAEQKVQTQTQAQVQTQEQLQVMTKEQIKEQARIQKKIAKEEKKQARIEAKNGASTHGTAVSETARNTESGPGKGEVVSTQAKTKSSMKSAKPDNDGKAARTKAAKGATVKTGKGKMPVGR
jgi:hypothetical protein